MAVRADGGGTTVWPLGQIHLVSRGYSSEKDVHYCCGVWVYDKRTMLLSERCSMGTEASGHGGSYCSSGRAFLPERESKNLIFSIQDEKIFIKRHRQFLGAVVCPAFFQPSWRTAVLSYDRFEFLHCLDSLEPVLYRRLGICGMFLCSRGLWILF